MLEQQTEADITTEQSVEVYDIRERFQEMLGENRYTVTPEEAEQYLKQAGGTLSIVMQALSNVANFLRRDQSKWQDDEVVMKLVPDAISNELLKKSQQVPVVVPESVLRIKAARRQTGRMTRVEIRENLIIEAKSRCSLTVSLEDCDRWLGTGATVPQLLQSMNRVHTIQSKNKNLSRAEIMDAFGRFLDDEKARAAQRHTE